MGFAPPGYLTVADAAARLHMTTWDVLQLINADHLETVTLIDADSLTKYQQETA